MARPKPILRSGKLSIYLAKEHLLSIDKLSEQRFKRNRSACARFLLAEGLRTLLLSDEAFREHLDAITVNEVKRIDYKPRPIKSTIHKLLSEDSGKSEQPDYSSY